jgi:hypothetical protein
MYALVATTGYLLLVDVIGKTVLPLESHRPEYYGVSWFPGSDELVLSHSGLDNDTLVDIASYATSEIGWVSWTGGTSERLLSGPHQLVCASDGRIVCTNTGRNALVVIDPKRPGHYQEARLSAARWDRLSREEATGDHLNSVFEKDGRLYVVAHRFTKGSVIATLAYPSLEQIAVTTAVGRCGLHNIFVTDDGQMISCDSPAGTLCNVTTGDVLWDSGTPIYTRGLAVSADVMVIGESQRTSRDLRRHSTSGLWVVDRRSWETLDYLCLGPFGAVHEVRLLDVPDEAHHGGIFPDIDALRRRGRDAPMVHERLVAAAAAGSVRERWRDFELVFGAPAARAEGWRHSDDLCLALKRDGDGRDIAFDYELDGPLGAAHVSAVFDYRGDGEDRHMTALLIERLDDAAAALAVWRHDGDSWCKVDLIASTLPLTGRVMLATSDGILRLRVDEALVLDRQACELADGGRIGMRWMGAGVRPVT